MARTFTLLEWKGLRHRITHLALRTGIASQEGRHDLSSHFLQTVDSGPPPDRTSLLIKALHHLCLVHPWERPRRQAGEQRRVHPCTWPTRLLPASGELRRRQRAARRVGAAGLRAMRRAAAPEPLDVLIRCANRYRERLTLSLLRHSSAPEGAAGRIGVLLIRLGPIRLFEDSAGRPEPADPLALDRAGAVRRKGDPVVGVGLVDDARLAGLHEVHWDV